MNEKREPGPVGEGEEFPAVGELREEDVTPGDRLDDRVQEGEGLAGEPQDES